jgi:hypothetical protein
MKPLFDSKIFHLPKGAQFTIQRLPKIYHGDDGGRFIIGLAALVYRDSMDWPQKIHGA